MYAVDLYGKHSAIKVFNQRRDAGINCDQRLVVRGNFVKLYPAKSVYVKNKDFFRCVVSLLQKFIKIISIFLKLKNHHFVDIDR